MVFDLISKFKEIFNFENNSMKLMPFKYPFQFDNLL